MNLGQVMDGLITIYNIYKDCNSKAIEEKLRDLKRSLKEIHKMLPAPMGEDYRKKRLKTKSSELKLLDAGMLSSIIQLVKKSVKISSEIYEIVAKTGKDYPTISEISKLFGYNTEFSKYFFKELSKEEEIYILEIITSEQQRQILPLFIGNLTLTRKGGPEDFVISDNLISRPHCKIVRNNTHVTIEDLKSRNATYLNGIMIRSIVPVEPGDEIKIGCTNIKLQVIKSNAIIDTLESYITKTTFKQHENVYSKILLAVMIFVAFIMLILIVVATFSKHKEMSSSFIPGKIENTRE